MQRQMWKGCRQREWAILDQERARELQESQRSLDSVIRSATKDWRQKYLKLVIANQGWKRRQEALKLKPKRDILQSVRQQQEKDRLAKKGSKSKKSKCDSDRRRPVYRVALLVGAKGEAAVEASHGSHPASTRGLYVVLCESVTRLFANRGRLTWRRHEYVVCLCGCLVAGELWRCGRSWARTCSGRKRRAWRA
jgi:hypothetical protein